VADLGPGQFRLLICADCGVRLAPGSNFCDMCGAPVGEVPPTSWAGAEPEAQRPYAPQARLKPAQPAVAAVQGRLVVEGTNAMLSFPPGKTEFTIGREDPVSGLFPEIDLTDHGGDGGGVSREHARITVWGAQVFIEDLNSTNFTYVNQQRLTPGQAHLLNDGDEVRLGQVKLTYRE
jgi:pSer/pThr/pTyr-binding forkhead associated (FHA) protein